MARNLLTESKRRRSAGRKLQTGTPDKIYPPDTLQAGFIYRVVEKGSHGVKISGCNSYRYLSSFGVFLSPSQCWGQMPKAHKRGRQVYHHPVSLLRYFFIGYTAFSLITKIATKLFYQKSYFKSRKNIGCLQWWALKNRVVRLYQGKDAVTYKWDSYYGPRL